MKVKQKIQFGIFIVAILLSFTVANNTKTGTEVNSKYEQQTLTIDTIFKKTNDFFTQSGTTGYVDEKVTVGQLQAA